MKLTHKDYVIETALYGGYDLYKKIIVEKKKTGEKYDDTHILGYNMSLEKAVLKIIEREVADQDETYEIQKGLKEILKVYNEIKNAIKL